MAKQDAEKFIAYLDNDIASLNQVLTMSGVDGTLDFAFTKGYVFTPEEFRAALKEAPAGRAADKLRTKLNIQAINRPAETGTA
jgi:Nif11 domain